MSGAKTTRFDLFDFAQAVEERDIDYQASRYAADAEMLIIDPDNSRSTPRVGGRSAIHA